MNKFIMKKILLSANCCTINIHMAKAKKDDWDDIEWKQGLFIKIIVCVALKYTFTIWVLKFYDETYTLMYFGYKKGTQQKEPQKIV